MRLAAVAVLACALPALAHLHLRGAVDTLEDRLTAAVGVPVSIAAVEVGATGTVRLRNIRVGDAVTVDEVALDASISALLAGEAVLGAARVVGPRVHLDADGIAELRAVARRLGERARRAPDPGVAPRPRIAIEDGALHLDTDARALVGVPGRVRLDLVDVSAQPHGTGWRLVAATADARLAAPALHLHGRWRRAAADLDGSGRLLRLLAVAGEGTARIPSGRVLPLRAHDLTIQRAGGDALLVTGALEEGRVELALTRRDRRGRLQAERLPLALLADVLPAGIDASAAAFTGELHWRHDDATRLGGRARLDGLVIDHRRFADVPVPLDLDLAGSVTVARAGSGWVLRADQLQLSRTGAVLHLQGEARGDRGSAWPRALHLAARVPSIPCQRALLAIPAPLRRSLDGLALRGRTSASLTLSYGAANAGARPAATIDVDLDPDDCRVLAEADRADPSQLREPFSHPVAGGTRLVTPGGPDYARLDDMPAHLRDAFVVAEDARFFDHAGFDLHQIERSLAVDLTRLALVRGGSTISQQLVKNLFLNPRRTVARKVQEAILTWRLEAHLDKRSILERYLNVIELGPGIRGVRAAARHWFDSDVAALSPRQAAFLAALAPAPTTISARLSGAAAPDPSTDARVDAILDQMRGSRRLSAAAHRRARAEALALVRHTGPTHARL